MIQSHGIDSWYRFMELTHGTGSSFCSLAYTLPQLSY